MVYPIVVYGCENWTTKKAEHWRSDAFELWCWSRLLRSPWTARRSNQSILKEISLNIHWKDWCWSWTSNTLATWFEELTHLKRPWCWKRAKAGGDRDDRGWDGWVVSRTRCAWIWVNSGSWWWTGSLACCDSWGHKESDTTERLNWTEQRIYKTIKKYRSNKLGDSHHLVPRLYEMTVIKTNISTEQQTNCRNRVHK